MESKITFDDLPLEMKAFIFSFFDLHELNWTVAIICKKWRHLCSDPFIWKNLIFSWDWRTKSFPDVVSILNRNQFVRRVKFHEIGDFNWVTRVVRRKSVRSIQFISCTFTKAILSSLVDTFPNVEQIKLIYCAFVNDAILDIANWNRMKSVSFHGFRFKHDDDKEDITRYIPLLAERIECLEEIEIGLYLNINNRDFQQLMEVRGKNLKYVKIFLLKIEEMSYHKMAKSCVNVKQLCLSYPKFITDRCLFTLLKNLSSLQTLHIYFTYDKVFTNDVASIFGTTIFPSLVELTMHCYDYNDTVLKSFVKCFPLLKNLTITYASKITDEGLQIFPNACGLLERLCFDSLKLITKECVDEIASQLPQLRYCSAIRCPLVKNEALYEIGYKYARNTRINS